MFFCVQSNSDWIFLWSRNRGEKPAEVFFFSLFLYVFDQSSSSVLGVQPAQNISDQQFMFQLQQHQQHSSVFTYVSLSLKSSWLHCECWGFWGIKNKSKNKKRVLQTLRGHGLSTQDQGECQRPDVKRFFCGGGWGGDSVVFKDCRCSEHLHWSRTVLTAKQQFQQVGGLQSEGQEECGPVALREKTKRFENNSCTPPVSECCKYKLDLLLQV